MTTDVASPSTFDDDRALVAALREGDEDAFRELVARHHGMLRRVASIWVDERVVDEVVQETWTAVITAIHRFEGRSSIKTWLFRILVNQARKRGTRERRSIPFSAAAPRDESPIVDPDRLLHPELGPNYWPAAPATWEGDPEGRLLSSEIRSVLIAAIESLPPAQREVITLRDVEGWDAAETCTAMGISSANQRVLLHRARAAVRGAMEEHHGG
ncbi:MAG: sigma-70 family RNA polymerase sigma factor [Nitriliruptorales bacterium]|nr:sigma-70 family RNA polymerase sigma factor [Nitriliruptorales bacterium]